MKKVKKLLAMIMAMTMVLGMAMTVSAAPKTTDEIKVTGLADSGINSAEYVQIIVPDADAETGYAWATGVTVANETSVESFLQMNKQQQKDLLQHEETVLPTRNDMVMAADGLSASKDGLGAGVYAIFASNSPQQGTDDPSIIYTNPMIVSIEYEQAVYNVETGEYSYTLKEQQNHNVVAAKYEKIPVTKTSKDTDGAVGISDVVEYEIVTFMPSKTDSSFDKFIIKDTLTNATYIKNSVENPEAVVVTVNGTKQSNLTGIISYTGTPENMIIDLTSLISDENAGARVVITYKVTVTGTQVENEITPGEGSHDFDEDVVKLYTGGIKFIKYGEEQVTLPEAKFVVYKTVGEVDYYATATNTTDGWVLTGWTKDLEAATLLETDAKGEIILDGLDIGTYYFKEMQAPNGYSVNESAESVEVKQGNLDKTSEETPEVQYIRAEGNMTDTKLASLPSTGGIGTTIFTIGGCAIMIAAAALFFVSRRKNEEN